MLGTLALRCFNQLAVKKTKAQLLNLKIGHFGNKSNEKFL